MTRCNSSSLQLAASELGGLRLLESRLGRYVEPMGAPVGFVATEAQRHGDTFTLAGKTLAGKRASVCIEDPANAFLPRWINKLASAMRTAWDSNFTQEIQALIVQHGLPVDPAVRWDPILGRIYSKAGVKLKPGPGGDDDLEEVIHSAIFLGLIHRDMLARFNPDALGDDVPLAKKVTIYLLKVFRWLASERGGVVDSYQEGNYRESQTLDAPLTPDDSNGVLRRDTLTDEDDLSQEDYVIQESDIHSLEDFRARFFDYIQHHRAGDTSEKIMLLFDLIVTSHDGVEISNRWAEATGTSYSNQRKTLKVLKDEMLKFIESNHLPGSRMSQIVQEIRNRTKPPLEMEPDPLEPVVKQSSEREFIPNFIRAVQAAARVVDQSMLYIRLQASPTKGPRFLEISFYNPTRRHLPQMGTYRVEVGDRTTDPGLPERAIKGQLSTFVVPHMRGDALDADQDLLEKVIRRLRKIVWENAVVYFDIPMEEKTSWRNVIKLDIQTLADTKVVVQDKDHGAEVVARSVGGEQNLTPAEQQDLEPLPDKTASMLYPDETNLPKGRIVSEIIGGQATSVQASEDPNDSRPDDPEPSPAAKRTGTEAFDPELHDKDADLSITHMSEHLKALGISDTAENMHAAVEGFEEARDAHYKKEASMAFVKFASLKLVASQTPEEFGKALDTLIESLQTQVENLTTMKENLSGGGAPAHVEGDPAPAAPVPGAPETISAGLQETAEEHPEQIEEAFGEFYLAMDKILSMTENFADALDIPLPDAAVEEEEPAEVEEEVVEEKPKDE